MEMTESSMEGKQIAKEKEFIANAAHELRAPLSIIRGYAETLKDHPALPPSVICQTAGKIVNASLRLERLLENLLTLSCLRDESSTLSQPIDLVLWIQEFVGWADQRFSKRNIVWKNEACEAFVVIDPELLEIALMNLLDNAVKYSSPPTSVEVIVWEKQGEAGISVRDQGIGIPEESLPRIFSRFYRGHSLTHGVKGTGLGLSMVQSIVRLYQGSITVASEPGNGSLFTLRFPLCQSH